MEVVADLEDIKRMPYVRAALAESLRMYPQPPILIRRSLGEDVLPAPLNGDPAGYPIGKGADIFISVWNLHRCAACTTMLPCPGLFPHGSGLSLVRSDGQDYAQNWTWLQVCSA